ncbi:MAG: CSLREA domain-containing protein, partial [Pseudomonadales bacterium]|nr:CSLREA domain-containing protein [Pseudomonadales bacterium]
MKSRFLFVICSILGITPAFGAVTLKVNTTNDEFGENLANCSLREAIESVNTHSAFGGCIAGQRYGTNIIQLEAKEYLLSRGEFTLISDVTISGVGSNFEEKDTITLIKPKRHAPTTTINAQGKSRFFNTAIYKPSITLNNIKLSHGYSEDIGGAVLAGGGISTFNVIFDNNIAKKDGGAVYLIGKSATLSTSSSLWKNNQVIQGSGAAIAMSCLDDLKPTTRTLEITQSSIVLNGSTTAKSVIEVCGVLTLNVKSSTIGENTANSAGAIINFNNETSSSSTFNIEASTLVQNKVAPVINFNNIKGITTSHSIIAFNEGTACNGIDNSKITYLGRYSLFQNCDFLNKANADNTTSNNVFLPTPLPVQFSDEFNPLANYGGYTPTYLPKTTSQYVFNKGGVCSERVDQRASSYPDEIICDLGSVERRVAVAIVDRDSVITNIKTNDRGIELSVLDNDIPSETDLADDQPDARGKIAKDTDGKYLIELATNSNGQCTIVHRTADNLLPL